MTTVLMSLFPGNSWKYVSHRQMSEQGSLLRNTAVTPLHGVGGGGGSVGMKVLLFHGAAYSCSPLRTKKNRIR